MPLKTRISRHPWPTVIYYSLGSNELNLVIIRDFHPFNYVWLGCSKTREVLGM